MMELLNFYRGFEEKYDNKLSNQELQEYWYSFMRRHEYVRKLCIDDYRKQGVDWRDIASEKVFTYDNYFVEEMNNTSSLLEDIILSMRDKLKSFFNLECEDTVIIIYHGLGNAAGWVTTFNGRPAIYLGVEKIVELSWNTKEKLEDLVSHEYGHLVHMEVRNRPLAPFIDFRKKMIFRMYTEGVATYCESLFNGRDVSSPEWVKKALSIERDLCDEFVKRLNINDESCEEFFGDWHPVLGVIEAGYFLGLRVIEVLVKKIGIKNVMKLDYDAIETFFMSYLNNGSIWGELNV